MAAIYLGEDLWVFDQMSVKPIGEEESRRMLRYIFLLFGISALILVIILTVAYFHYLSSPQKNFYITFGGDLTFTDDSKSTWLIDNREDHHEKLLQVHWTGNTTEGITAPVRVLNLLTNQARSLIQTV